jgi:hypothetical protein
MSTLSDFVPLRLVLPGWPTSLIALPELIDQIGLADFTPATLGESSISGSGTLQILTEIEAHLPAIPGLSLALLNSGDLSEISFDIAYEDEGFALNLYALSAALRFQTDLLKRMEADGAGFVEAPPDPETGLPQPVEIVLSAADLNVLSGGDFTVSFAEGAPTLTVSPFMIGDTGVIVEVGSLALILSATAAAALPPTIPSDWRGVYLDQATIHLPEGLNGILPDDVTLQDFFIGAGGVCGTVSGAWDVDPDNPFDAQSGDILGYQFRTTSVAIEFKQNALVAGSIRGYLQVPFFEDPVEVEIGLTMDGGFTLGVDTPDGLFTLRKEGVFELEVNGLALESGEGGPRLTLSGAIVPEVLDLQWPTIDLGGLTIGADGTIHLEDGWLDLPTPISVDLYGFQLEISRIGFGNTDDGRRWIGLSAGVHLIDFLPTGVSVEGLRITWDPTGARPVEVSLQGVGLTLTLPGVLTLDGDVAFINEEDERYFEGNIKLAILPLGVTLDAAIKVGRNLVDDYKFVYTFMDLTLPVGLPLWATGAALYGLAGLYGMNVNPTAQGGAWYAWYTGAPKFNVTDAGKWAGAEDGKALGAGMTLGTLFDLGRAVSAKALFVLVLPGPVLMLDGKANFLQTPPDNDDPSSEGVLNALAVFDGRAGDLQLNIDAGWNLSQVLDIAASAEAYFDFSDPRNWHFYLGQDQPEERRIRADLLGLLHGDAYLMLSMDGIATGAGISWGYDWKFGPVAVILKAWIGAAAEITWQPPQFEGGLNLGGTFEVSVAGFGAGLSAEATLSGKAPTLYWVRGDLEIDIKLPFPLKDIEADVTLEWRQEATPPSDDPLQSISLTHPKVDETWAAYETGEQTPTDAGFDPGPLVPLDARPALAFDRGMKDVTVGRSFTSVNAYPGGAQVGEHVFDYELTEVVLEKWPKSGGTAWMPVEDVYGAWQAVDGEGGEPAFSRLQLWTQSPFAFTRQTSRTYRDDFLTRHAGWPCIEPPAEETICVNWDGVEAGTELGPAFVHGGLQFTLLGSTVAQVVVANDLGCETQHALRLEDGLGALWIVFPEPVAAVELCLSGTFVSVGAYANGVLVASEFDPEPGLVGFRADNIDTVVLAVSDNSKLARVCYQTQAMTDAVLSAYEHALSLYSGLQRWSSADEILEPETWYRLTVREVVARTHNGTRNETPYAHSVYFHTAGAPGLTPAWGLDPALTDSGAQAPYPTGGTLTSLAPYITWTIPADGAQPVYRAYDFGAEFNEAYVEQMVGADMAIRLTDANDQPVVDAEGQEVVFPNQWAAQPTAELSETELAYTTQVENCLGGPGSGYVADQKIAFANGVLFEENFDGDLSQWTDPAPDAGGGWSVVAGQLHYDNASMPPLGALLVAGEEVWRDYALEVALSVDGADVGLVWRYTVDEVETYYRLRLNAVGRSLERIVAGVTVVLWQDAMMYLPVDGQVLGIQCLGPRLRGQLGGELLFDLVDDEPLLGGQIGIFTNATAAFDHVLVRAWPGATLGAQTQYRAELQASSVIHTGGLSGGWTDPAYAWTTLTNANNTLAVIGREVWTDYRVEVNAAAVGRRIGLLARFDQPTATTFTCLRFFLNLHDSSAHLELLTGTITGSTFAVTATETVWLCAGTGCAIDFNLSTHALALTCVGQRVTVEVDGVEVFSDDVADVALTGQAGLYQLGADAPDFSELVIRTAPRETVHAWSFVTSRYAGLVEHLDTFSGQVWSETVSGVDEDALAMLVADGVGVLAGLAADLADERALLAGASPDEVSTRRAAVLNAVAALQTEAAAQFEACYDLLLAGVYRPLPSVVELTEVVQGGRRLALLIDSPEPFDWRRLSWALRRLTPALGTYRRVVNAHLIWSADGTRALVLADGAPALRDGDYEWQLTATLDLGLEAPQLRRGGSLLPEIARLRFGL